jgi:hypothetical protein
MYLLCVSTYYKQLFLKKITIFAEIQITTIVVDYIEWKSKC